MTDNRTEKSRRGGSVTRRRVLATAGVATAGAIAGCAGDSSGTPTDAGDDGGDGDGDSGTPTDTGPRTSGGIEVSGESTVGPLVVDGLERQGGNEDKVVIVTTVRNAGEQTTDVFEYNYDLALYDADGAEIGTNTGFGTTGEPRSRPASRRRSTSASRSKATCRRSPAPRSRSAARGCSRRARAVNLDRTAAGPVPNRHA
jgi:hypothetical protein